MWVKKRYNRRKKSTVVRRNYYWRYAPVRGVFYEDTRAIPTPDVIRARRWRGRGGRLATRSLSLLFPFSLAEHCFLRDRRCNKASARKRESGCKIEGERNCSPVGKNGFTEPEMKTSFPEWALRNEKSSRRGRRDKLSRGWTATRSMSVPSRPPLRFTVGCRRHFFPRMPRYSCWNSRDITIDF